MSTAPGINEQEFNFWQFVACAKCQLPFLFEAGPTVPFWLTNCGHVVCNSHLSPNQSCVVCETPDIQVAPLQQEMDPPMSSWFRSVPDELYNVAFAVKFQLETMGSQISFFRAKHQQLRIGIDKLRRDVSELNRRNQELFHENDQFRQQLGLPRHNPNDNQIPSGNPNSNGKRPMVSAQYHDRDRKPMTSSSPHSIATPVGPNRLTLLPGQQVPELSNHQNAAIMDQSDPAHLQPDARTAHPTQQRPTSSRLIQEYAYRPPQTPQFHTLPLSYTQAAPETLQPQQPSYDGQKPPHSQSSSKFRPAPLPPDPGSSIRHSSSVRPTQAQNTGNVSQARRLTNMGPPPTPRHVHQAQNGSFMQAPPSVRGNPSGVLPPGTSQGANNARRLVTAPLSATTPQRFFPSSNRASQLAFGSRTSSRAILPTAASGDQRRPFFAQGT